jgi:hypothetical protein
MNRKAFRAATRARFLAALILACALSASAVEVKRWRLGGTSAADYTSGLDTRNTYNGLATVYLRSKVSQISGFGTLLQDVRADQYQGKRVRFRAAVKTDYLARWAGLWMRVDKTPQQPPLAFDNMYNRPITKNCDWQTYDVVLDVPRGAQSIFFGVLLAGSGELWISNVQIQVVGPNVPVTGKPISPEEWRNRHPDAWNLDYKAS